jgi:hypothetical protein
MESWSCEELTFQIHVADQSRSAVAGSANVDHAERPLLDQPVEMDIDKVLTRRGAKMTEQSFLDITEFERNFQ